MNDFSVVEAKIGEKQSRQSNSKYKFMQYVFFGPSVWNALPDIKGQHTFSVYF